MLPDGEIARGGGGIRRAWLSDPTDRYGHGVLGDAIEAGALVLEDAAGVAHRHVLGAASVFEDRRVRLHDLDGDGRDEAIVVRSYLEAGAALAVFALDGAGVRHVAEIPPIGRPNRWLNPAGAGDFDGDGAVEIAFVETPHIGGTLRLYELRGGALTADGAAHGFSNHAIGTRELGMSAVLDWNGDGVPDLAVPDTGRTSVRLVSFAGVFAEIDRVAHGQPIASALLPMAAANGRVHLVYALSDGTLVAAAPSR